MRQYTITIGRQFGAGGRELARGISEAFGIPYYDKELLVEAARESGLDKGLFERSDERFPSFVSGALSFNMGVSALPWYAPSSLADDSVYHILSDVMHSIADRGPCVFVGRSADYVLRDHPSPRVDIFVHASMDDRVRRILARGDKADSQKARVLAGKADKLRASYYNFFTDKRWGDSASYDLSVNSSKLSTDAIVGLVAGFLRGAYGIDPLAGG